MCVNARGRWCSLVTGLRHIWVPARRRDPGEFVSWGCPSEPRVTCWPSPGGNRSKGSDHRAQQHFRRKEGIKVFTSFSALFFCFISPLITSTSIKHSQALVDPKALSGSAGAGAAVLWGCGLKSLTSYPLFSPQAKLCCFPLSSPALLISMSSLWIWNKLAARFYHTQMNKGKTLHPFSSSFSL